MAKQISILLVALFFISVNTFAQKDDPILFSVEKTPVRLSEFQYIYDKTNGDEADYSKESLEEYLDLYVKFKLKVQKARGMKLDTIPALKQELQGYRRQLADSYLLDREVTDKLVKEAYDRQMQDIDVSHIMVAVQRTASAVDTLKAYKKIQDVQQKMKNGKTFEELAKEYSEDPTSKAKGGRIGYITAVLPNGFYALENTAYTLPKGKTSNIIRTDMGYHLVKINDKRTARGEMEVAHILVRKDKDGTNKERAAQTADKIYQQIEEGANFEELAKQVSEDKLTANKGGYLGFFGINRYENVFENIAFGLEKDGAISKPVETSAGFHIIKRISKKEIQPFNVVKGRLEQGIRKDSRFELAKKSMIERIKKENNFTQTNGVLNSLKDTLSEDFLTFKWRASDKKPKDILFSFGNDYRVTLGDYMDYAQKAARQRINLGRSGKSAKEVADDLYMDFVAEQALTYEEQQLEDKYPDFKSLMREYEEGILLFEATKMLVWDKASQDSIGLKEFFKTVDGKYKWDDRAVVTGYSVSSSGVAKLEEIRKYAATHTAEETLQKFNKGGGNLVSAEENVIEKGRNKVLDQLEWKTGTLSDNSGNKETRSLMFYKIESIIPPTNKPLQDARGYVVADYQDYLEKEWVKKLRKEYDVKINKRIFNKMIK